MIKIIEFLKKYYSKVITLIVFLILWQLGVMIFKIKEFIIPSPISVFNHLFNPAFAAQYKWKINTWVTLLEVLISFGVTAASGILLAIILIWSKFWRKVITPALILMNSLPKIAFAPLFLLWFGYGLIPNILIAVLIAFFPVIINTASGLIAVEEDMLDLVNYLHASKFQIFVKIRIPNSLPYIFSGLKVSTTLCVVGAIVGEFVASDKGLGYIMKDAQALIDTPTMFASLIVISILGLSLFAFISFLEHIVMPWQADGLNTSKAEA